MRRMYSKSQIEEIAQEVAQEVVDNTFPTLWHHKITLTASAQKSYTFEVDLPYETKVETKADIPWTQLQYLPFTGNEIVSSTPQSFKGLSYNVGGVAPSDQLNFVGWAGTSTFTSSIYITMTTWTSITDTVTPQ